MFWGVDQATMSPLSLGALSFEGEEWAGAIAG